MGNDQIFGLGVALVILAVYAGLIVVGVRLAKSKNRSPHWMWFAVHPIGLIVVLIVMACIGALKRCPQCAQRVQGQARLCSFCGYSFTATGGSQPAVPGAPLGPLNAAYESNISSTDWAAVRARNLPKPPRFSIGGLVVSGLSLLALLMIVINGPPLLAAITLWLGAAVAMLIWTFGRRRRWWQGVAAWFGGGFAGYAIGFLPLALPSFAGLSFVAVFFLIGVGLLWLGFKRFKKQPATAADEAEMNPEEKVKLV